MNPSVHLVTAYLHMGMQHVGHNGTGCGPFARDETGENNNSATTGTKIQRNLLFIGSFHCSVQCLPLLLPSRFDGKKSR